MMYINTESIIIRNKIVYSFDPEFSTSSREFQCVPRSRLPPEVWVWTDVH